MISRSQMNRQLYQMGGEGMQDDQQMQDEQFMQDEQSMQDNQGIMQVAPQQMQAPTQAQPQMDPKQALQTIVKMLIAEGIPQEEAIKIALQMIQAVTQGGMQEVSDENRIQARFGGRIGYADGGISRLVDREQYGFGSVFKSVGKIVGGAAKAVSGVVKGVANVVKKVASSDLGKMALMAAAIYAGGGGFSPGGFSLTGTAGSSAGGLLGAGGQFSLGNSYLGQQLLGSAPLYDAVGGGTKGLLGKIGVTSGYGASIIPSGISSLIPGKGTLISAGAGLLGGALAGGMQPPQQEDETGNAERDAEVAEQYGNIRSNLTPPNYFPNNPFYTQTQFAANGGRMKLEAGGIGNIITQATQEGFFNKPQMPMMANGGRMGYAVGSSVQEGIMAAPQIASQMGMPVGNPRMNEGGIPELDYRDEGGFVPPIGIKERADDIPAMLSNNEFVFTADAVKNAGGGDSNVGAQKMYTLMKRLESGGRV
jgi:hypothetical protein